MKGIKKTFMASALACAAFNVHAEVSPFGYGIKGSIGASSAVGYGNKTKISGKDAQSSLLDTAVGFGGIYFEYAFTDYVGMGVEAGYLRQGAGFTEKEESKSGDDSGSAASSISMVNSGIVVPLYLCIYPLGREEEEGIFKIMAGGSFYCPYQSTYKKGDQELTLTSQQKNEQAPYDIAFLGGIGYEFSFGLSVEGKYSYGFRNRFKTEKDKAQTIFTESNASVSGLENLRMQNATFSVGYNFASLLSE